MFAAFIVFATVGYKVVDPATNQPTQTAGYVMIIFGVSVCRLPFSPC